MRPIKLTMSAFGVFSELVTLELDKLGENGLYLITGDTGAGKTTIFDGIIYALYGEASGNIRTTDMLRSKYANESTKTFVELTFVFKEQEYVVSRNPEYLRPSKRGDKYTKETAKAQLIMPNGDIITGIVSVNNKIIEIIGLNRNQFSQIAMLPQGEFLKLLLAGTKERIEIFREIFDTKTYLDIQDKVKNDANALYRQISDYKKSMVQYINDICCDKDSKYLYALENIKKDTGLGTVAETIELILNIIKQDKDMQLAYEENILQLDKQIESISTKLALTLQYEKIKTDYENAIFEYDDIKNLFEAAKQEYQTECDKQVQREKIAVAIEKKKSGLVKYKRLEEIQNNLIVKQKDINTLNKELQITQEKLDKLKQQEKEYKLALNELSSCEVNYEKITRTIDNILKKKESIEYLRKIAKNQCEIYDKAKRAKEEYIFAHEDYKKAQSEYMDMEEAFLNEQAGIIAKTLVIGKPCPVCGSIEHPHPAIVNDIAPTESELKKLKKEVENKSKIYSELSSQSGQLNGQVENISNMFKQAVDNFNTQWNENIRVDYPISSDLESIDIGNIYKTNDTYMTIYKLLDITNKELSATKLKKDSISCDVDRYHKLLKVVPECELQIENYTLKINDYNNNIAISTVEYKELNNQFIDLKQELECDNLKEAERIITDMQLKKDKLDKAYIASREKYDECAIKLETLKTRLNDLKTQLENNQGLQANTSSLNTQLNNIKTDRANIRNQKNEVDIRISNNKKILGYIKSINEKVKVKEDNYRWLRSLSDTVNGSLSGKSRIKLETYVQMAFFDRIIMRANTRFMLLTNGQFELKRSESKDNYKNQTGLELDIIDHYNATVRSVKSLSGGEAFEASLSMALGMSDEIQSRSGGIQIDTMFIDEGFGSLDDESLSQAVKVLYSLSASNRLIGIISHVSMLKDKIDKQIIVTKQKNGESKAQIVV